MNAPLNATMWAIAKVADEKGARYTVQIEWLDSNAGGHWHTISRRCKKADALADAAAWTPSEKHPAYHVWIYNTGDYTKIDSEHVIAKICLADCWRHRGTDWQHR